MLFDILIPTIETRADYLRRLLDGLNPQLGSGCQVLMLSDNGEDTIGGKRQRLIELSKAEYVAFVDDDDTVSGDYCSRIMTALSEKPEIVGFRSRQFIDGRQVATCVHSTAERGYPEDRASRGLLRHKRINHLNPIRREIAMDVGFMPWNSGEDRDYTMRLLAGFPAMREVWIDAFLYDYWYRTDRSQEITNDSRSTE